MSMAELREGCVSRFPLSTTRQRIMAGLETVLVRLNGAKIERDVWIDGSFLTQKIDPEDVDFVLRISGGMCDHCSAEQSEALNWLGSEAPRVDHRCHGFVFFEYPEGQPNYGQGQWMRAYWIRQFGFSRGHDMKGMVVIKLPRGAV